MEHYDVIVVGGSASGAPTAMLLAKQGHKVLMVEKSVFPRDVNSTHFIWPRGMSYLNRWGLADQITSKTPYFNNLEINIEGISLYGSVPSSLIKQRFKKLHGSDEGIVDYYAAPRRYLLDSVLMEGARNAGVDVREGTQVKELLFEDGKVVGVTGSASNGKPFEARAKIVVGADGRMSKFVKHVNAKTTLLKEKSTFAYYGYYSGIDKDELAIHKRGRVGTAIFPTMENKHLVLVYGPTSWWDDFRTHAEENLLKTYEYCAPDVAKLIKNATLVEPFKGMGSMPAFHRENWGDGWVLVGDAGSFKDQWSAMGITHSFRDAELLAQNLNNYLAGECSLSHALKHYADVREADYNEYFDMVCAGAEMNPYDKDTLTFLYKIKDNPQLVNQFMAKIGDTLPLNEGDSPAENSALTLPEFIQQFNPEALGYNNCLYQSSQPSKKTLESPAIPELLTV